MSTERDIIIERLEQKLAAKDREIEQMQESLRKTIIEEIENRFSEKLKLRESTIDDIKLKMGEKVNDILEMNKSLRDSILEKQNASSDNMKNTEERISRLERRLVELSSAYEGIMKEMLDQKSIIQELKAKKASREEPGARSEVRHEVRQEIKPEIGSKHETRPSAYRPFDRPKEVTKLPEETKQVEKPKPKGEYIIADNYVPKDKRKQQAIIEADDKEQVAEEKPEQKPVVNKPTFKRSERVKEGVEIYETPKRGR